MIRRCTPADVPDLLEIYNPYIEQTVISFEEAPVTLSEMERRVREVGARFPWLVRELEGRVIGYAYANSWNPRSAYHRSAESSIYLDMQHVGRGLGEDLYRSLLLELRAQQLHRVVAGIALPNDPSVRFHERFGFRKAGHFSEIGYKLGRFVDVGYWVLELGA